MKSRSSNAPPAPYRRLTLKSLLPAVVLVLCAAALGCLQYHVSKADDVLMPELARVEAEWKKIAPRYEEAKSVRDRYEAFLNQAQRIKTEDSAQEWLPMVRLLINLKNAGIEIRAVSVHPTPQGARNWQLQLEGSATGTAPRIVAEGYRLALQRNMEALFRVDQPLQFTTVAEQPAEGDAQPAAARAVFTLKATFSPKTP